MNEELMRKAEFNKEMDRVKEEKCPHCGILIKDQVFRNPISVREYKISGLCQKCQDEIFGED